MRIAEGNKRLSRAAIDRRRRGAALLWVALCLMVILGFVGLATDTGYIMLGANHLKNGGAGAALAPAANVRPGAATARTAAINTAAANHAAQASIQLNSNDANTATGDIVLGHF